MKKMMSKIWDNEGQGSVGNSTQEFQDLVARMAYELFERHGSRHGYHLEDWLEAERLVRTETVTK